MNVTTPTMTMTTDIELTTRDEVLELMKRTSRLSLRAPARTVRVALPDVPAAEATRAQLRLNAAAQDCGCTMASAFMSAGAVASVGYLWATLGSPLDADAAQLAAAAAGVTALAVVGKLAGLLRARTAFIGDLRALAGAVATHRPAGGA